MRIDELISDLTSTSDISGSAEPVDKSGLADLNVVFEDDFESAGVGTADISRADMSSLDEAFGTLPGAYDSSSGPSGQSTSTPVVLPSSVAIESRYNLRSRKN